MAQLKKLKRVVLEYDDGSQDDLAGFVLNPSLRPIKKTSVKDAIKKYNDTCTVKKVLHSRNAERLYFNKFVNFLNEKNIQYIDEVERDHIDQFEQILSDRKMKNSSVNRRMSPIKSLFIKSMEWKLIFENPCANKKILKEEDNPYRPWSPELMRKFINLCEGTWKDIFHFLWMTGCRPMELKNLRWVDVDHEQKQLTLRCGKNSQVSRKFDMTSELDKFLHNLKMEGPFVFSQNGRQLSGDNLYQYCKHRMKKLGIVGYTVYGIRHGFATNLAKNGANAFELAEAMGHASLDTTSRYVHTDKNSLNAKKIKANKY